MRKNEGLTLVEMITVIGIMAVLIGVVGISVKVLSRQRVSSAASDVKELMQTAQTIAMSKRSCYVEITCENGLAKFTTYVTETNDDELNPGTTTTAVKKIASLTLSRGIQVELAGDVGAQVTDGCSYRFRFDRASGAYKDIGIGVGGSYVENSFDTERIVFSRGASNTATITISKLTGRVSYGE